MRLRTQAIRGTDMSIAVTKADDDYDEEEDADRDEGNDDDDGDHYDD